MEISFENFTFAIKVLESLAENPADRTIEKEKKAIVKRYNALKNTFGFIEASRIAKAEWLQSYILKFKSDVV